MIEYDMQAGMEFLKQISDKVKQLSTLSQNQFNQYYAKRIDISASLGNMVGLFREPQHLSIQESGSVLLSYMVKGRY